MKWMLVEDYDVFLAKDSESAINIMQKEMVPLVILDLGLPPDPEGVDEGFHLLSQLLRKNSSAKIVVVSGNPDKEAPLKAIAKGAHDFFAKPIDADELRGILKRASYVLNLEKEYQSLQKKIQDKDFAEMIGSSPKIEEIFTAVRKLATTDVSVLITGESGTGKELVARAIHNQSIRNNGVFVPINCGAIPENLMESELFGHEKGSFTGAHVQRKGKIELANSGTLFLDEVGDLPLPLQVKLLRFLQDQKLERIGGRETLELDVRVVAATNKNLEDMIHAGAFREDLYYRLAVVTIELPPLRSRGDDVILLAKSFLQNYACEKDNKKSLSSDAIEAIKSYAWPGNVRELENKIQRAITFAEGTSISAADMSLKVRKKTGDSLNLKMAKEDLEIEYIQLALNKNKGNISRASIDLGLTRPTLHGLLKKYKLHK